jgi:hypothetical protein
MPKIGFSRNYFAEEKTRGPRRLGPPWTSGHGRPRELAGARPPATPGLKVVGVGAGEEEGSTEVPIPGSPGSEGGRAAEQRRNGGEGSDGEALGAGSLWVGREGKEGRGRSGGRRGHQGALL